MSYSYAGWLCFNVGWRTDQISILFVLAMTFENCYKNIIEALYCDWSNWVGITAKYFDSCSSSSSQDVQIYEYKPYGTYHKVKLNNDCWPGPWIALTDSPIGQAVFEQMINYLNVEREFDVEDEFEE